MLLNKCDNTYGMRPNSCNSFASLHRRRHFWFHEKNSKRKEGKKNRENCSGFAIFGRFQLWFHEKNQQIPNKTKNRENVMVLQFLVVFNFHFMRKIKKFTRNKNFVIVKFKRLIFGLLKSGILGGEFIFFKLNSVIYKLLGGAGAHYSKVT